MAASIATKALMLPLMAAMCSGVRKKPVLATIQTLVVSLGDRVNGLVGSASQTRSWNANVVMEIAPRDSRNSAVLVK